MVTGVLGHLRGGPWVLLQVLTTWMSALHPQNMLEQLLIHQPKDPIPFMINHLQRDNDNGEHPSPPLLGTAVNTVLLCLKEGQNRVGRGFDNLGWWLIEKCLDFFGSTTNKNSLSELLKENVRVAHRINY